MPDTHSTCTDRTNTPAEHAGIHRANAASADPRNDLLGRLRDVEWRLAAAANLLNAVYEEVRAYPDAPPFSTDSYLPPHLVACIGKTLVDLIEHLGPQEIADTAESNHA